MSLCNFIEKVILYGTRNGWFNWIPDKLYLKMIYRIRMKKVLNFSEPKTFNEKLQWLKVNNRSEAYTTLVDKYSVRAYIKKMIGEKYLIPLLGVWDRLEDIDIDSLPDQFVLKTTHDSGGVFICNDKSKFDKDKAYQKLKSSLGHDYYGESREWPYKNVKRRIIAEAFMKDTKSAELKDFKFYCFNGVPKILTISNDRSSDNETCFDYYDMEFNHLPFQQGGPNYTGEIQKPIAFDEMIEVAKKLSKGLIHVRIDLYNIGGIIYFGEWTFYDSSGFEKFYPKEWDYTIGNMIELP